MQEVLRPSSYVVRYRKVHLFRVTPEELWGVVERPELFPQMWPWMKHPRLDADRVEAGASLSFVIDPPFPYRMKVMAHFTKVEAPSLIRADIVGDLEGVAKIKFREHPGGTRADVSWSVELKQKRMRVAARVARPVLIRGHNWAVRVALRGFRRQLSAGT